jgi:hypothetical protein
VIQSESFFVDTTKPSITLTLSINTTVDGVVGAPWFEIVTTLNGGIRLSTAIPFCADAGSSIAVAAIAPNVEDFSQETIYLTGYYVAPPLPS